METLIIQLGARPGRVRELFRSHGESVSIGRGFDNQLVLTDPYVAPNQASFRFEDGNWIFDNHDATNRVLLNNEVLSTQQQVLKSGDRLMLGRTEIQVFSPDHAMPPTRKLLLSDWLHHDSIGVLAPLLALLACNLLDFGVDYLLDATREVDWKSDVINLLWLNLYLLIWSGIWAITGKLVRHQHHFGQQLFISSTWLILLILLFPFRDYFEFASNGGALSSILTVLVMLVMVTGLVKFNLYFATSGRHATVVGMVVSVIVVGGVLAINFLSQDDFNTRAEASNELYPGFMLYGNGASSGNYFAELEAMLETSEQEHKRDALTEN